MRREARPPSWEVRYHVEHIDAVHDAMLADIFEVKRGMIHACGAFILIDARTRWRGEAEESARIQLQKRILETFGGRVPVIGGVSYGLYSPGLYSEKDAWPATKK